MDKKWIYGGGVGGEKKERTFQTIWAGKQILPIQDPAVGMTDGRYEVGYRYAPASKDVE